MAQAAAILGDLWTILIVRDLIAGPKRFGDLSTSLDGISSRTLTKKLKGLEEQDIIERNTFNEYPPRVEYRVTKKGKKLGDITEAMRKYGEKWL